jgi:hypothetical protein
MSQQINCTSCGAVMTPQPDGRTYACAFCRAQVQVAIDGRQIAAGMALDLQNADAFLQRLAHVLTTGFAEQTKVQHHGGQIIVLEISLEPDLFIVKRERQGVLAQHKRIVRGIALKTVKHPLGRWVEMLTDALATHANTSAHADQVLRQLRGQ